MVETVTVALIVSSVVSGLAQGGGEAFFLSMRDFLLRKRQGTKNLEDVQRNPQDEDNLAALRKQLKELAQQDPETVEFLQSLQERFALEMHQEVENNTNTMRQTVSGDRQSAKMTQKVTNNDGDMIQEA